MTNSNRNSSLTVVDEAPATPTREGTLEMSDQPRKPRPSRRARLLRAGSVVFALTTASAIGAVVAGNASATILPKCPVTAVATYSGTTTSTSVSTICGGGYEQLGVRWQ
jgi:hypothetical protein